jgi:hypothetical protein
MSPTLTIILFVAAAGLFLTTCLWSRPVAMAVLAALLPTYLLRTSIGIPGADGLPALPTTLLEVLILEIFVVWLFTDGLKKGAWRALERWALPLALVLVGATAGALVSPDLRGAAGLWRAYFIEPILFFVVFTDVIKTAKQRATVLIGLGACLIVVGLTAVFQKITGFGIPNPVWQAAATRRVTSFFGFPNAIGLFAAPVIVLMAGWTTALLRAKDRRARRLAALPGTAVLLGCAAVIFAVSEGAIIGASAGLVALGLMIRPLRVPTLITIIAGCLIFSLFPPATRYAADLVSLRDDSGSVRLIVWRESAAMLADHPIFGAGLSGYRQTVAPYHQAKHIELFMYPHNLIMNFWSEIGLIGLAGFIWLFLKFFVDLVRSLHGRADGWLHRALIAAMIAVLVHGLVDVPYLKNDLTILFFILLGLTESLVMNPIQRPITSDAKPKNTAT